MKRKSNGGFTTVWLVMILSSLMVLLLVVTEAAAGFAASSIGENLCLVAGRSILSEYNTQLFENYGIFAVRAGDSRLTEAGSYYINSGLDMDRGLVRMTLADCSITGEEYPALSYELFMDQIRPLGVAMAVESIVSAESLSSLISGLVEQAEMASDMEALQIKSLEGLEDPGESEGLEDPGSAAENKDEVTEASEVSVKRDDLLDSYKKASNPDLDAEEGAVISETLKSTLPSAVLGVNSTFSLLLSGGLLDISADAIAAGEYILNMCSHFGKGDEGCLMNGEAEYILYGHSKDQSNELAVKLSIFQLRSAINLVGIYKDPALISRINAEALAFSPIPQPLAAFVIAYGLAAAQALEDVTALFSGGKVPFVDGGSGGSYEEYLRILLVLLPQKVKLVRLMDVIQMNLAEKGASFNFQDFCYGLRLDASFEKTRHLFGNGLPGKRQGKISIVTHYQ